MSGRSLRPRRKSVDYSAKVSVSNTPRWLKSSKRPVEEVDEGQRTDSEDAELRGPQKENDTPPKAKKSVKGRRGRKRATDDSTDDNAAHLTRHAPQKEALLPGAVQNKSQGTDHEPSQLEEINSPTPKGERRQGKGARKGSSQHTTDSETSRSDKEKATRRISKRLTKGSQQQDSDACSQEDSKVAAGKKRAEQPSNESQPSTTKKQRTGAQDIAKPVRAKAAIVVPDGEPEQPRAQRKGRKDSQPSKAADAHNGREAAIDSPTLARNGGAGEQPKEPSVAGGAVLVAVAEEQGAEAVLAAPETQPTPSQGFMELQADYQALCAKYEELKAQRIQSVEGAIAEIQTQEQERSTRARQLAAHWEAEAQRQAAIAQHGDVAKLQSSLAAARDDAAARERQLLEVDTQVMLIPPATARTVAGLDATLACQQTSRSQSLGLSELHGGEEQTERWDLVQLLTKEEEIVELRRRMTQLVHLVEQFEETRPEPSDAGQQEEAAADHEDVADAAAEHAEPHGTVEGSAAKSTLPSPGLVQSTLEAAKLMRDSPTGAEAGSQPAEGGSDESRTPTAIAAALRNGARTASPAVAGSAVPRGPPGQHVREPVAFCPEGASQSELYIPPQALATDPQPAKSASNRAATPLVPYPVGLSAQQQAPSQSRFGVEAAAASRPDLAAPATGTQVDDAHHGTPNIGRQLAFTPSSARHSGQPSLAHPGSVRQPKAAASAIPSEELDMKALEFVAEISVGRSSRRGGFRYRHAPTGFAFEIFEDDSDTDDDFEGGLRFRPLSLGGAGEVLPSFLKDEVVFAPDMRLRLFSKILDCLSNFH